MPFDNLDRVLRDECKLVLDAPVLIGFSGGPDSSALLRAMHGLGYRLIVAHLDHGLRSESAEDARHAERVAAAYGLPFFSARVDVGALARAGKLSIEEAARVERYKFLFRLARDHGAQAVAVAHNADDQAETVLMHLLRGAGTAGLRGMALRLLPNQWSESIPLVRPLLGIWRSEVLEYCQVYGLKPLHDASNADTAFFRNKLRHDLLPMLESYALGVKTRLLHSAELLSADHDLMEKLVQEAWRGCLAQRSQDFLAFDRAAFLAAPLALQRALLRRALAELRPQQRDIDFDAVERALNAIRVGATRQQDWLAGLFVMIERQMIWIADWTAELPADWPQAPAEAVHIEVPASLELNFGWQLSLAEVGTQGLQSRAEQNRDRYQAWLDLDASGDELLLRRPRPGDRFQPLGMPSGSLRLADLFVNEKLPRRARATWPLLCKGEQIVWVPGYRLAQPVRLQASSQRALQVQLSPAGVI